MKRRGRPKKHGIPVTERCVKEWNTPLSAEEIGKIAAYKTLCADTGVRLNVSRLARDMKRDEATVRRQLAGQKRLREENSEPKQTKQAKQTKQTAKKERRQRRVKELLKMKQRVKENGAETVKYPTATAVLKALPSSLRPKDASTIRRDWKDVGMRLYARPRCCRMTMRWRVTRHCHSARVRKLGRAGIGELYVSDESIFDDNEHDVNTKQVAERKVDVLPICQKKFPQQIMVWVCFGPGYRKIVVHEPKRMTLRQQKMAERRADSQRIREKYPDLRLTRYRLSELQKFSKEKKLRWLQREMERATVEELSSGVNRFTYVDKCLKPLAKHFAKLSQRGKTYTFIEDGARIHTSNYARIWQEVHGIQRPKHPHPTDSPDLNPCERPWAYLKPRVSARGPKTLAQLKQFVVEEFHKIPRSTLDKWLEAYWERIEECYRLQGEWVGDRNWKTKKPECSGWTFVEQQREGAGRKRGRDE